MEHFDLGIIGGGIVGLAAAYQFTKRYPGRSVALFEKEPELGQHQTGHNSGVIHSGIYYPPGSLKAKHCTRGKKLLEEFCTEQGVAFKICGKVIVAVDECELKPLETLYERAVANNVPCTKLDTAGLKVIEPHAAGIRAVHIPGTGIVDFRLVAKKLGSLVEKEGGSVRTGHWVFRIHSEPDSLLLESSHGTVRVNALVNCGGAYCDRIFKMCGGESPVQICPFRGEYYILKPEFAHLCRTLIYPVPDPRYPFLGVHFTRRVDDSVECGPNAVVALSREGYTWQDWRVGDMSEMLRYSGFRRFIFKNLRAGVGELRRSLSKKLFVESLQRLVPEIREEHVEPGGSGVRAQAVRPDGTLENDFLITVAHRSIHLLNAPSPAATSSLAIGEVLLNECVGRFFSPVE